MVSFWKVQKSIAPPTVPTDAVIPVHYWDDTALCRAAVLYDLMRFDDALDVGKLKMSLEKLLRREGWQKLGARNNGRLDYHVPKTFNKTRVPFSFHHESLETSITEHPVASRLPVRSSSATPEIMGRGEDFIELMRGPGDPETLQDYLTSDLPMLGLRIISFVDATLLTISWPHILVDGMGRKAFLNAWSLILHGREDEVPPFYGVEADPLATLGTQPSETYKRADKQLGVWQMATWGLRYLFDKLWNPRQTEESRIVFIPATYVRLLREQALSDIERLHDDGLGDVSFISEGDVLCAWWTRQLVRAQVPENSSRTVAINNAFGLRGLLSDDLLPPDHAYIANAFCMVPVFMPAKDVLGKPLGLVAASVRKAFIDLGTRPQVDALAALHRAAQSRGSVALFGDPWMHLIVCTNWTKAELFNADFSGALLVAEGQRRRDHQKEQSAGKPSLILAHAFAQGFSIINGFMITGRDADGNVWIYGILRSEVWPAIEQALEDIA